MGFFAVSVKTSLKRIITPYSLFPAFVFAAALLLGGYIERELILQPDIGVHCESGGIADEITANLQSFANINVIEYDTREKMLEDVAAHKIESGYVFGEDTDRYVKNGTINKAAFLYKSPATVSDGFTNELVFAAIMKAAAPYVAANYLNARSGSDYGQMLPDAQTTIKSYYDEDIFLDIRVIPTGSGGEPPRQNRISAGIVSVFLFIMFFYAAADSAEEKKHGHFQKLTCGKRLAYLVSYVCARAIGIFLISLLSIIFVSWKNPIYTLPVLAVYCCLLGVLSFAAAVCFKSSRTLYAILPVVSVFVIILGGAFFDLEVINPALGAVSRAFPTYWFVRFLA